MTVRGRPRSRPTSSSAGRDDRGLSRSSVFRRRERSKRSPGLPDRGFARAACDSARDSSRNFAATRLPRAAANARRESPDAPIRASAITIRLLRKLLRRSCEKKFSTRGIAALLPFVRAARWKFFSARGCAVLHREDCDSAKTLVPCGFLRNVKKRTAALKCSPRKTARAMHCIVVVRAMRAAYAVIAHFLLTGFGVSCLLLYKLQRDARRIG